jgi:hypothetical protein
VNELIRFVQAVLDQATERHAAEQARCAEVEAEGFRIVDGGQTTPYDDDSKCGYAISDFRTGEVLARGHGTYEEFDAAWDTMGDKLGQPLYHRDRIFDEVLDRDDNRAWPATTLPKSLATALQEWADGYQDDARAWMTAAALEGARSAG